MILKPYHQTERFSVVLKAQVKLSSFNLAAIVAALNACAMKSTFTINVILLDGLICMIITNHFRERLFERCGIVLTEEEEKEIIKRIQSTHQGISFGEEEWFDVFLHHKNTRFVAILRGEKLVTAHAGKRMSYKKFKKQWNSGRIKKS